MPSDQEEEGVQTPATKGRSTRSAKAGMSLSQRWRRVSLPNKLTIAIGAIVAATAILQLVIEQGKSDSEATRDSSLLERAWVRTDGMRLHAEPTGSPGEELTIDVAVLNQGKTPALNATTRAIYDFGTPRTDPTRWRTTKANSPSIMHPNQPLTVRLTVADSKGPYVAAYLAGQMRLSVQTLICYDDVFGRRHWVTTCMERAIGMKLGEHFSCATGHDMGILDGKQPHPCDR